MAAAESRTQEESTVRKDFRNMSQFQRTRPLSCVLLQRPSQDTAPLPAKLGQVRLCRMLGKLGGQRPSWCGPLRGSEGGLGLLVDPEQASSGKNLAPDLMRPPPRGC